MFILEGEAEVLLWVPRPHSDGDSGVGDGGGTKDGAFAPAAPLCGGRDASPIDAGARSQVRSSRSILLLGKQLQRGDPIAVVGCRAFCAFSDCSAYHRSVYQCSCVSAQHSAPETAERLHSAGGGIAAPPIASIPPGLAHVRLFGSLDLRYLAGRSAAGLCHCAQ